MEPLLEACDAGSDEPRRSCTPLAHNGRSGARETPSNVSRPALVDGFVTQRTTTEGRPDACGRQALRVPAPDGGPALVGLVLVFVASRLAVVESFPDHVASAQNLNPVPK
jgi:hypothetical protein